MIYINNNHIDILTRKVPCPERLNVELTTYCNIKCIMCRGSLNYIDKNDANKYLTANDFKTILNGIDLDRLKVLNLAGEAEPLLNPDILSILDICREKKIIVEFITNGMLLTPQISKKILGCSSEIHISFGGSTKKTFESIRQGANFETVCGNIKYLSELKKTNSNRYPDIWLNPILMKRNIHELPDIIELAKEIGCRGVACSHLTVNSNELIDESLFFHKEECNSYLQKAETVANNYKMPLFKPEYFSVESNSDTENDVSPEAWNKCRFLWNHAILGIDGIMPCPSNTGINFDGDIVNNNFMDIWNNDWYADTRYKLLTGNPPDYCRTCKDPSVKDVNKIGSYFTEDILPEAVNFEHFHTTKSLPKKLELSY